MKPAEEIIDRIRRVRNAEYSGRQGAAKSEHCARYNTAKAESVRRARRRLDRELDAVGEAITCRKGCMHCCQHYITASIAEGLVITDYLYQNSKALDCFRESYSGWQEKAEEICGNFDRLRSLARLTGTTVEAYRASVAAAHQDYAALAIDCPFLTTDNDCAIYPVRPLSCAIHCSVDPPKRCSPASAQAPRCYDIVPDEKGMAALAAFWQPEWIATSLTMPLLVYGLLTRGQAFVDEIKDW